MKDKIIEILKKSDKALNIYEIKDELKLESITDFQKLSSELKSLEDEFVIYHSNKDRYMMLADSHLKKGVIDVNRKGFGFVRCEGLNDDIYIDMNNINGAINDDVVLVEITSKMNTDRVEGRILKVIKRAQETYIGEVNFFKGIGHIKLDDEKIKLNIEVPKDKAMNAVDGHKVVVKLLKRLNNNTKYEGEIIKIIGHKNDPGVDILSIIYKYNIEVELPDEVREQVKNIPTEVSESEYQNRKDLRNEMIFTIDGDDTKDIDDAISIKKLGNGNYELGVHIADVSHYVTEDTPLDKDAMERGTSVYLVDRVIPMLPHELSNGICSLNPNVDRLAISCVMEFDNNGKQIRYDIFPSVIKSRKQMTYKKVNKLLEENIVVEGYDEYSDTLKLMNELAHILRKMKVRRGYINFMVDEAKILVDEACVPTDIVLREQGEGERLIEDFMIAANECVATHIYFMQLPFIYRIHEYPLEEKIRNFLGFVGTLGYQIPGNIKDNRPQTIQRILEYLKDKKEFSILSSLLLRCMQKAIYSKENKGHYGLASKCYTHFTSPIRRYPDTTVHRLLRTYLFNSDLSPRTISHWDQKLIYIAENSSLKERSSVDCEREVDDMKMAEYMEKNIGKEYVGMIDSVTNFGMFVQLDNLIEGLVPLRDMKGFYNYNEELMSLTEEKTNLKYTIGDKVLVRVVRASKEDKKIDFEIIKKV